MIASHGIVVVGVWKLDSPVNSFNASWMDATITFVEKRLENNLHNNGKIVAHFKCCFKSLHILKLYNN